MLSKKQVIVISDSDDDEPPSKRTKTTKTGKERNKPAAVARSEQQDERRSKQSTLTFHNSQEERKGGLSLSTSQPDHASKPAGAKPGPLKKVFTGSELWTEKHAPKAEDDLIIHKKKVLTLKDFLQSQLSVIAPAARLMVISGPTGCGKSTTLRVLAAAMGFKVTEWEAPVPMLWSEHVHQADKDLQYVSKLDAFESFVSRAKLAPLALAPSSQSMHATEQPSPSSRATESRKLILVDDMPHAAGPDHRRRLADALAILATTARGPVVVIITEAQSSNDRSSIAFAGASQGLHTDLTRTLDAAGALQLSFNPITTLNILKVLDRVAIAEGLPLEPDQVRSIAEASNGDLFNALETLQLFGSGKADPALLARKGKRKGRAKVKQKAGGKTATGSVAKAFDSATAALGRDVTLGMFHALGKFLYNKRLEPGTEPTASPVEQTSRPSILGPMSCGNEAVVAPRYDRASMSFDPEEVLMASGMEPSSATAFLHENFQNFVEDEAIADTATALSYLSHADRLLSHGWASTSDVSLDGVAAGSTYQEAIGGSLAVRGLLWSNAHPSPKRWLPLKGPLWFTVQRGITANMQQMQRITWAGAGKQDAGGRGSARDLAVGSLPFLRVMASYPHGKHALQQLPLKWSRIWEGKLEAEDRQRCWPQMEELCEQLSINEQLNNDDEIVEDADDD